MRADEKSVRAARVKSERPESLAWKPRALRINSQPGHARIHRAIEPATVLVSATGENLIAVMRIDQDARVIAVRQIAASARPALAPVVRVIKGLLRADVDITGARLILFDSTDRSAGRDTPDLLPRRAAVARDQNAGDGRPDPDSVWILRACGN